MEASGYKTLTLVTDVNQTAANQLADKFSVWLGEWFMDTRIGVPYLQTVFVKNPSLNAIKQLFRQIILGQPPVIECTDLSLQYDPKARTLAYSFLARTASGATISGGSGQPFIVKQ